MAGDRVSGADRGAAVISIDGVRLVRAAAAVDGAADGATLASLPPDLLLALLRHGGEKGVERLLGPGLPPEVVKARSLALNVLFAAIGLGEEDKPA